jgi:hypothetical protein
VQFTSFTSTKVQIPTQKTRRLVCCGGAAPSSCSSTKVQTQTRESLYLVFLWWCCTQPSSCSSRKVQIPTLEPLRASAPNLAVAVVQKYRYRRANLFASYFCGGAAPKPSSRSSRKVQKPTRRLVCCGGAAPSSCSSRKVQKPTREPLRLVFLWGCLHPAVDLLYTYNSTTVQKYKC